MPHLFFARSNKGYSMGEFIVETDDIGSEGGYFQYASLSAVVDVQYISQEPWIAFHSAISFSGPFEDRHVYADMMGVLDELLDAELEPWKQDIIDNDQSRRQREIAHRERVAAREREAAEQRNRVHVQLAPNSAPLASAFTDVTRQALDFMRAMTPPSFPIPDLDEPVDGIDLTTWRDDEF